MSTVYTCRWKDHLIPLTMIAYSDQEYRFHYLLTSWKLVLSDDGKRGKATINHLVQDVGDHKVTTPIVKLREDDEGYWHSQVLYKKDGQLERVKSCNSRARSVLDCVAITLKIIYG